MNMKFIDAKSGTLIEFDVENYDKDPKFWIGDLLRIWKFRDVFS